MKVKCINNKYYINRLTIGKMYDAFDYSEYFYKIKDDHNYEEKYPKRWFVSYMEIRNQKINKLLEE